MLTNPDLAFPDRRLASLRLSSVDNVPVPGFVPHQVRGVRGVRGKGKGPGQRLRTGVRPVGNRLGLRCLLGARALSRPNPPSSQMSAAAPFGATPSLEGGWMLAPSTMT